MMFPRSRKGLQKLFKKQKTVKQKYGFFLRFLYMILLGIEIRLKSCRRAIRLGFVSQGHCGYCGVALDPKYQTIDHVTPRVTGGTDDWENILVVCSPCNNLKGNLTIGTFRKLYTHGKGFYFETGEPVTIYRPHKRRYQTYTATEPGFFPMNKSLRERLKKQGILSE